MYLHLQKVKTVYGDVYWIEPNPNRTLLACYTSAGKHRLSPREKGRKDRDRLLLHRGNVAEVLADKVVSLEKATK